jgi:hypothetical protein
MHYLGIKYGCQQCYTADYSGREIHVLYGFLSLENLNREFEFCLWQ